MAAGPVLKYGDRRMRNPSPCSLGLQPRSPPVRASASSQEPHPSHPQGLGHTRASSRSSADHIEPNPVAGFQHPTRPTPPGWVGAAHHPQDGRGSPGLRTSPPLPQNAFPPLKSMLKGGNNRNLPQRAVVRINYLIRGKFSDVRLADSKLLVTVR